MNAKQRHEMAMQAAEEERKAKLAAVMSVRVDRDLLRSMRTTVDPEKLAFAKTYVEEMPAGRLKDALMQLSKLTRMEVNLSMAGLDILHLEIAMVLLKNNKLCERVTLTDNDIDEHGAFWIADMLKCNMTLKSLVLLGNQIGDRGAIILSEALEINETLLHLDLSRNFIRRDGAKHLAKALLTNRTLEELLLVGNWIQTEGRKALAKVLGAEYHLPPMMKNMKTTVAGKVRTIKLF